MGLSSDDLLLSPLISTHRYTYTAHGLVLETCSFVGTICEQMQVACRTKEGCCEKKLILLTRGRNTKGSKAPIMFGNPLKLAYVVKYISVTLEAN